MKRVSVRFEKDARRDDVDVLFTASEIDDQVVALMNKVADPMSSTWEATDDAGATVMVPEESILVVSTDNKRLRVYAESGTYWMRMSLSKAEELLNPSAFLRVSRYDIVNLHKVERFDFSVSSELRIELEGGQEVWVSRRFIPVVRERLQRRV